MRKRKMLERFLFPKPLWSMTPKSCRLFGQDHAPEQMLRAKSQFNLKRFRLGSAGGQF
jgi:hypothetical protein